MVNLAIGGDHMRMLPLACALLATMVIIYAAFYALSAVIEAARWANERGIDVQLVTLSMVMTAPLLSLLLRLQRSVAAAREGS